MVKEEKLWKDYEKIAVKNLAQSCWKAHQRPIEALKQVNTSFYISIICIYACAKVNFAQTHVYAPMYVSYIENS